MLISEAYANEQRKMHKNERYGAASKKVAPLIARFIEARKPESILDYGAGKQALAEALGIEVAAYDPGVQAISQLPDGKFDLVCCIDVLEHVEPDCLADVLTAMSEKTGKTAFITIHTGPAGKKLSDGRNAHLIQKPIRWWTKRLKGVFKSVSAEMHNATTILAICEN